MAHEMHPGTTPEIAQDVVSFEQYREVCEELSTSYRKTGVLTPEGYEAALASTETEFYSLPGTGTMPLIVGPEAMDGYDIERSKALTGKEKIHLLALPVEGITEDVALKGEYGDAAIIVETDRSKTSDAQSALPELLRQDGSRLAAYDFVDKRIEEEKHQTAWMSIYTAHVDLAEPDRPQLAGSLEDANVMMGGILRPENGLTLYTGNDLVDNPDIADELWLLFRDRFGWLGDYHPVSMEDTRELFDQLVMGPGSFVSTKFVDGKPVSAGIFMHDLQDCSEWLSQRCIQSLQSEAGKGYTPIFFPGIAARAENIGSSQELIAYHSGLAAAAGIRYALSFESSNMSSTYIPRLVKEYVNDSGSLVIDGDVESKGTQDYWYLKAA
jgi:hypothetical protein